MSRQPDSRKALHLKPNQRTLPEKKSGKKTNSGQWVAHKGSAALDGWGVAIRVLRQSGKLP